MAQQGSLLDGRYRLGALLGAGGMGDVHAAVDERTGERVAVKTIRRDLSGSASLRERFEREARALFALEHPNVVAVRDFGIDAGAPYVVTELLSGHTLDGLLSLQTRLDPTRGLALAHQLLCALAFAHAQGVVHRDLKASNVFVTTEPGGGERAKLLDFGLVRFVDDAQWGAAASITAEGSVLGSPAYISPEQALGGRGDARSDVYSAGVLLFEILTGAQPFVESDRTRLFRAHLAKAVPPLASARADLHAHDALEALVQRAMAKRPDERFSDAVGMLAALDAIPSPAARVRR